ncbi:NUDIX hydrolase [Nocardioides mangrovicus]|uniref:NUDIX hydrolase n=1 Tax=Nocardioides mangrovicus TaxID=2478913 RepID=UPI0013146606|nr:NUDIX hydrolase [Nocardioides mangrovicus]
MAEEPVVAAGTVVLRDGGVLLLHRPKYDDWSFPKGKQEPDEHVVTTAVRETLEETGLAVRLGRPLPTQTYVQRDGRSKLVHYWRAEVVGDPGVSGYEPNDEVDQVAWVPIEEAAARLTYSRDVAVLGDAVKHPKPTTPLVLLRHTKALGRKSWDDDDRLRPLTEQGRAQALALVPVLAAYGITRVVSSTSTRCEQTVSPFAAEQGLSLTATPVLAEEHEPNPQDACALLDELLADPEPTVVCTHRPLLPGLLDHLGIDVPTLSPGDLVVAHHRRQRLRAAELHETDV